MGNKKQNQQDLGRFCMDSNVPGRGGYGNDLPHDTSADQGAWITSNEQFDELYKSVDKFEKFLRS